MAHELGDEAGKALIRLDHRALPLVVDLVSCAGRRVLITELVCGAPLHVSLHRSPDSTTVRSWWKGLVDCLETAHRQCGGLPVELSLDNLVVTRHGDLRLRSRKPCSPSPYPALRDLAALAQVFQTFLAPPIQQPRGRRTRGFWAMVASAVLGVRTWGCARSS